ncbi:hypothetical protein ACTFIY_008746 [Dictyostelium cf. discoideum]
MEKGIIDTLKNNEDNINTLLNFLNKEFIDKNKQLECDRLNDFYTLNKRKRSYGEFNTHDFNNIKKFLQELNENNSDDKKNIVVLFSEASIKSDEFQKLFCRNLEMEPLDYVNSADEKSLHGEFPKSKTLKKKTPTPKKRGISTPITSTKKRCISTKATSPPTSQSTHIINTEMNEDEEIEEINTFEDTGNENEEAGNENEETGNENEETSNGNEESGNGNEEAGTENEEEGNEHEDAGEETEEAGDEESLLDLPFSSVLDRDLTQKISSISATMEEKRDYIFYIYLRKTLEDSLNSEKLNELILGTEIIMINDEGTKLSYLNESIQKLVNPNTSEDIINSTKLGIKSNIGQGWLNFIEKSIECFKDNKIIGSNISKIFLVPAVDKKVEKFENDYTLSNIHFPTAQQILSIYFKNKCHHTNTLQNLSSKHQTCYGIKTSVHRFGLGGNPKTILRLFKNAFFFSYRIKFNEDYKRFLNYINYLNEQSDIKGKTNADYHSFALEGGGKEIPHNTIFSPKENLKNVLNEMKFQEQKRALSASLENQNIAAIVEDAQDLKVLRSARTNYYLTKTNSIKPKIDIEDSHYMALKDEKATFELYKAKFESLQMKMAYIKCKKEFENLLNEYGEIHSENENN